MVSSSETTSSSWGWNPFLAHPSCGVCVGVLHWLDSGVTASASVGVSFICSSGGADDEDATASRYLLYFLVLRTNLNHLKRGRRPWPPPSFPPLSVLSVAGDGSRPPDVPGVIEFLCKIVESRIAKYTSLGRIEINLVG
nr:exocyst complex component EXO70B1-like isoform X1 [Ipomoea trifida]